MKIKEVTDLIQEIEKFCEEGDDEVAHVREDEMREKVLRAIAEGNAEDARYMAELALSTDELDFARWCF